jgi:hypothetical protein
MPSPQFSLPSHFTGFANIQYIRAESQSGMLQAIINLAQQDSARLQHSGYH